ncbi:MAG: FecR family protein [Bacteroidales bacterium]
MRRNNILRELNGDKTPLYYKVLRIVYAIKGPATKEEIRSKKQAVRNRIFAEIEKEPEKPKYRDLRVALMSIAATLIVVCFSLLFYVTNHSTNASDQLAQNVEMYSPFGLISKVTLPDGSKVILNNNSKISYPLIFSKKQRIVTISGEAYFEVEKDEKRPFIVKTNGLDVKVLGTKFNVRSYDNHQETVVSLREGAVQVVSDKDQTTMVLEPGDQLSLNRKNGDMSRSKVNVDWFVSWTDGHLVYRNQTLLQIFSDLENRFNVKIECSDPKLLKDSYYVSFSHGETLEYIMELLSYKRNWQYIKIEHGKKIKILRK